MKTVKITVTSAEKASRWEVLIRVIWATLCGIVLLVVGIFAAIAEIIQLLYILAFLDQNNLMAMRWSALDDDDKIYPPECLNLILCNDGFHDAEENNLRNFLILSEAAK